MSILADRIGWTLARVQHRVDAIVERDGGIEKAVTGPGVSIGYQLAKEIADLLREAQLALTPAVMPTETEIAGQIELYADIVGPTAGMNFRDRPVLYRHSAPLAKHLAQAWKCPSA